MVKQFQVGKRYRNTASYKEAICLFVCPNQQAVLQWDDGSIGIWSLSNSFEIVPPKPRTGTGFLKIYTDGGSNGLFLNRPTADGGRIFPITWTEVIDQDQTG